MHLVIGILLLLFALLFSGILLGVHNFFLSYNKGAVRRCVNMFLFIFIFYYGAMLLLILFNEEHPFSYEALPLGLFYAPLTVMLLNNYVEDLQTEVRIARPSYKLICSINLIPGMLFSLAYVFLLIANFDNSDYYRDTFSLVLYIFWGIQVIAYAFYGFFRLSKIKEFTTVRYLFGVNIWIMLLWSLITLGMFIIDNTINKSFAFLCFVILYLVSSVIHVYIGFKRNTLSRDSSSNLVQVGQTQNTMLFREATTTESVIPVDDEPKKYSKSEITDEQVKEYSYVIEQAVVGEHLFLDNTFTLDRLVEHTGITRHHLSQTFSKAYGLNFNSYINQQRVEYVKNFIRLNVDNDGFTIGSLGETSGFNSRTSFFRAFKRFEGVSPSEYLESLKG